MDETPQELRRQADHCRDLARSQHDERVRLILSDIAAEFDRRAGDMETAQARLPIEH